jgi:hypothetical protein
MPLSSTLERGGQPRTANDGTSIGLDISSEWMPPSIRGARLCWGLGGGGGGGGCVRYLDGKTVVGPNDDGKKAGGELSVLLLRPQVLSTRLGSSELGFYNEASTRGSYSPGR